MSVSANVRSVDRLARLREALARFGVDAQAALAAADQAVRRAEQQLEERLDYWRQMVHRRQEEVAQARAALSHARALHDGQSVGCVEQELELRRAQLRLREAEDKVTITRRWLLQWPVLVKELEASARSLSGFVEADLRQGVVLLDNKVAALQAYQQVAVPELKEPTS
jgi:hypothetical protein